MTEFVAIDGEQLADGPYVLLCASNGRARSHLVNPAGLATAEIFDFLLGLKAPGRRIVCYGLGYDVNQWLADVGKRCLRELWKDGETTWRRYRLRWVPNRWFTIRSQAVTVKITEVIGFFQTSFVRALAEWGVEPQPEIVAGKAARGTFTVRDVPRVRDYCFRECDDLVKLMDKLALAAESIGCTPHEWVGAGALAGALLNRYETAFHHRHDEQLTGSTIAREAIMRAYHGGRVEAFRIGSFYRVKAADINSAYPWALTYLPTLHDAQLTWSPTFLPNAAHGIWAVRWHNSDNLIAPFPVRNGGAIYWPREGAGIYHAVEVHAALAHGYDLDITGGWVLSHATRRGRMQEPFEWVPDAYRQRLAREMVGDPAAKVVKLALNSIYGKLAQGAGYNGGPPRWQSYYWAGELTARVRARMLAMLNATDPIAANTDGIYGHWDFGDEDPTRKLGHWREREHEVLFTAQPGLYVCEDGGELTVKSRGHFAGEIDYRALRDGFQHDGWLHVHHYNSQRFIGIGTALLRRDLKLWRQWLAEDRSVSFYPTRKVAGDPSRGELLPPVGRDLEPSEPYVPKLTAADSNIPENVQAGEQPRRTTL